MAKFITVVDGIAKLVDASGLEMPEIYDEILTIESTIIAGTPVYLPESGTYKGLELEVKLNGQYLTYAEDYTYGPGTNKTYVEFLFDLESGDKINFRKSRNL